MSFFHRLPWLSTPLLVLAGCAPSSVTVDEIVPIYESPCAVYDAGEPACSAQPDENGAYVDAWSQLPCADVCAALDTDDPSPVLACEPVHLALPTERLWLAGELMRVHKAPYTGTFTPYTAGMNGWVPMIQTIIAF